MLTYSIFKVIAIAVVLTTANHQGFRMASKATVESMQNSTERNRNATATNIATTTATPITTITPITSTVALLVTTASPLYLACFRSCLTTMQYNPVCGTDGIDYHNSGRLECARRCGKDVNIRNLGICSSTRI